MAETLEQKQLKAQEEAEAAVRKHDEETEAMLGSDEYKVLASYVTLKVKDDLGGMVVRGFNAGAVVKAEDVDPENLRHHVDTRLIVPSDHRDAEFAVPAGTPLPAEPPNVPPGRGTPAEMLSTEERTRRNREAADKAAEADKSTTSRTSRSVGKSS
jgi:hypothetical protein